MIRIKNSRAGLTLAAFGLAIGVALTSMGCVVHTYDARPGYVYRTSYAPGYTYTNTPQYGNVYVRRAPERHSPPPRGDRGRGGHYEYGHGRRHGREDGDRGGGRGRGHGNGRH